MLETFAKAIVYTMAIYASLGLMFAVPFVWLGVQRLDSEARGSGIGFRLLILPGVAAFWPMFLQVAKKSPGKNLGTWPTGDKRSFKFDQPGVAPVLCNVHPEMSGYIVVTPTPYFALTDKAGNYKINNVPDGQYNIVGWHEGAKAQSKPVAVSSDTRLDLTLSK